MSEVASGAGHAARAVGSEAVDVVVEYLIPIGAGVAGLVMGPAVFGGNAVLGSIYNASQNMVGGATIQRIGGALFGGIFGLIGYTFWRLGKRDDWTMKLVGKGLGAFFLGTAVGYVIYAIVPKSFPVGIIDKFFAGAEQIAGGG